MNQRALLGPIIAGATLLFCVALAGLGEVVARVIDLPGMASSSGGAEFDMPTWMLQEENTASRVSRRSPNSRELEWLSLFVEGDTFRVAMQPNRELSVFDSFNRIPERTDPRFSVKTNRLGFRSDDPLPPEEPRPLRVAIFGDSSCWGWGVNQDETFSSLVLDGLRKQVQGQRVELLNFAIPGDSSAYGRLLLERFLPDYPADIVVLGFGANDAKLVAVPHRDQVARFASTSLASRAGRWLRAHSVLYASLERMVIRQRRSGDAKKVTHQRPAVPRAEFERNLVAMARRSKELGAWHTVVVSLCSPASYQQAAARAARRAKGVFVNGQEALLSSIPQLQSRSIYPTEVAAMEGEYGASLRGDNLLYVTADGCHPNRVGHRIVAEQILAAMQTERVLGKIPRRASPEDGGARPATQEPRQHGVRP